MRIDLEESTQLIEHKIDGCVVYEGDFLHVQKDQISLPNGKNATREYIKHPGAVVVIPMFGDGRVLLERQFRYPLNQIFIEFPAGKIDADEDSLSCAKRELREETGYTANGWKYLCTIHNAIAYSDEHLQIYLATDLSEGIPELDEGEFLETFTLFPEEILRLIRDGEITDVKTVIGAFWLDKILTKQWII